VIPSPHLQQLQFGMAALVLIGALVLGGGQGTPGDSAVQVAAALLIGLCLWRHAGDETARLPVAAWFPVLPLAVVLLQWLPIPQGAWALAEARGDLATELAAAGVDPVHRWSLVPVSSERALVWLLPAVALFLAALQVGSSARHKLLGLLVLVAALSVLLGLAQIMAGPDSALFFYTFTNNRATVGFFANRNHFASLLAVCLPIAVIGTMAWYQRQEASSSLTRLGVLAGVGVVALFVLGVAITYSRAGLLLGMAGLLACLPIVLRMRRRRGTRRALGMALALGFTLVGQFALFGLLQRLEEDPLEDARLAVLPAVVETAKAHGPWGAGLGGFRRAFEPVDPEPGYAYINHAHNDWLELWVDAGPLGLSVAVVLLLALTWASWRVWPREPGAAPAGRAALPLAAALGLWLLAAHSLADYPLRTSAMLAVAGLFGGIVAAALRARRPRPPQGHLDPHAA